MRNDLTPEEKIERRTDIRNSQSTSFSLQSDKGHLKRKQDEVLDEIHRIKTQIAHLNISLEEKEAVVRSLKREMELVDEELARTKKHMNML